MFPKPMIVVFIILLLSACGALEPKFYPQEKTITSTLFPSNREEKNDPEFERKVQLMLSGNKDELARISTPKDSLITDKGKLLIVNSLTGLDTSLLDEFKQSIYQQSTNIVDVEYIAVSSLPALNTLRLMGARQGAKYVLILNSFSNVYRYHNAWTIPTIFGLGLPYFFLDTQTIKVFAKIEYSLLDIKENVILSNESVTTEAESKAVLPESGIEQFITTNKAIAEGFGLLRQKFLAKL